MALGTELAVPLDDQIKEIRRELAMRDKLYPVWVGKGTLAPGKAAAQLRALQAVLRTLEELKEARAPSG